MQIISKLKNWNCFSNQLRKKNPENLKKWNEFFNQKLIWVFGDLEGDWLKTQI